MYQLKSLFATVPFELSEETPFSDEVLHKQYNPSNERIQHANYKMDLEIAS